MQSCQGATPASDAGAWSVQDQQLEKDEGHDVWEAKATGTSCGWPKIEKDQLEPF